MTDADPRRACDLLLSGGLVVTLDVHDRIIRDGAVAIQGDRTVDIGPRVEIEARWRAERTLSGRDRVIIPGLINIHNHTPLMATRGCPYRCTFCSSPSMWGTNWYARDPRDVIAEIKCYLTQYRIEHLEFYDLTAVVDRRWIMEFTALLRAERLPITWRLPSGTRSEALDEEVLGAMVASGCEAIVYAPESGSPRTLARVKKRVKDRKSVV